jgi:anti-sigma regulatory factor (Ser/Thr protein kinase)
MSEMMADRQEIVLAARETEISRALEFVEEIMVRAGFSPPKVLEVQLAVEEACMNIALHAYPDGEGSFKITSDPTENGLVVTIEDQGMRFDPTKAEEPSLEEDVDERPIGGLGIHLIKSFVEDVRYEFKDGKNMLILVIKME